MQRDLTAEYVAELVATAPPLQPEQLHKLRVLLSLDVNSKTRQRANASGSQNAITQFDDATQVKEQRRRGGRPMSMMPPARPSARSGGAAA